MIDGDTCEETTSNSLLWSLVWEDTLPAYKAESLEDTDEDRRLKVVKSFETV